MIDRRVAAFCAFLGLGALAVFIGFFVLPDVQAAIASGCGKANSLTQFQQARSMRDLIEVFSAPAGACRADMIAAMNAANRLDLFVFIPVYGAFLVAALVMLAPSWKEGLGLAGLAAIAIALFGDALETAVQLRITADVEGARTLIAPLAAGYWIKYGGLALFAGLAASLAVAKRAYVTAAFAGLAALAVVAAAANLAPNAIMLVTTGLFWLALLILALRAVAFRTS